MRLPLFAPLARLIAFDNAPDGGTPPAPVVTDPPVPPVVVPPAPVAGDPPAPVKAEKVSAIKTALKFPDGRTPDDALLERTAATASELGLSPEAAQRLLDDRIQDTDAVRQSVLDSLAFEGAEWTRQNEAHKTAALADPDIGAGDPAKLANSVEKAQRGMAALFGTDTKAIETFITNAGLASEPTLVKAFMRAADKMSEAQIIAPTTPSKTVGMRPADKFYDNTPSAPS